jgi:hypothetical protein
MMAEETSVQESPADPGAKAAWMDAMANTVEGWPEMKAVVWFNSDRIYPWWFDSSPQALAAMQAIANNPYFNPEMSTPVPLTAPSVISPPQISGSATVGRILSTSAGSWTGATSFTYQWTRCAQTSACAAIVGADSPTYTLATADLGENVKVTVTASNTGGSASADSNQTPPVAIPPDPLIIATTITPRTLRTFSTLRVVTNQRAIVTISIINRNGVTVRHKLNSRQEPAGTLTVRWSGFNDTGHHVPPGTYTINVHAAAENVSATRSAMVSVP